MTQAVHSIEIVGKRNPEFDKILTVEALEFIGELEKHFGSERRKLLQKRHKRMEALRHGSHPTFLPDTENIRKSKWTVAKAPSDLQNRRVEITGPVERKMMINALNSGANVFMADLEDSLSPTWTNVVEGQANLKEAVRKALTFTSAEGKDYKLNDRIATLLVRPRGWHLEENHALYDGQPVSASLFDFGLYFFHNAAELINRESGPYFYLPKMESHLEARLWNDVFNFAQDYLKIPRGTIRATVLLETILAAFEMDEILFELKDHISGLNAGRWDYIFSIIKKFSNRKSFILPNRAQVTMNVPFMRAYCDLLVQTCHKRGAYAMGGMAAFIPSRREEDINKLAMDKVREDKSREANQGFDGTWVAHPDLVSVAMDIFDEHLGAKANQIDNLREDVVVTDDQIADVAIEGSTITEGGLASNIDVGLQYIESWLRGVGAAAIHNLMEDAATAEISRAQLWQWIKHNVWMADGREINEELYMSLRERILDDLLKTSQENGKGKGRFNEAAEILDALVLAAEFPEFLTTVAYKYLPE